MKKILIIGPISDFGGREVEANFIAKTFAKKYAVSIFSTVYCTSKSYAFYNSNIPWSSLQIELQKKYFWLRIMCFFVKLIRSAKMNNYGYIKNKISKVVYNFQKISVDALEYEISKSDLVFVCGQISSEFLPEIISICEQKSIPCVVRTTGTIGEISSAKLQIVSKATCFVHHSVSNAMNLYNQKKHFYHIIDQTCNFENKLLLGANSFVKPLKFGYLGRLSSEKGIVELTTFFASTSYVFYIAGSGTDDSKIQTLIQNTNNCYFEGKIDSDDINLFFSKIDVLIIPSFEETGPLVGLEAMAAGKIIISTKVGAMPERLSGLQSFWFDNTDLQTLQNQIDAVNGCTASEIANISISYRNRYIQNYSNSILENKYLNLISQYL